LTIFNAVAVAVERQNQAQASRIGRRVLFKCVSTSDDGFSIQKIVVATKRTEHGWAAAFSDYRIGFVLYFRVYDHYKRVASVFVERYGISIVIRTYWQLYQHRGKNLQVRRCRRPLAVRVWTLFRSSCISDTNLCALYAWICHKHSHENRSQTHYQHDSSYFFSILHILFNIFNQKRVVVFRYHEIFLESNSSSTSVIFYIFSCFLN